MDKLRNSKKFIFLAILILFLSLFSLYQLFAKSETEAVYEGILISLFNDSDSMTILVDGQYVHKNSDELSPGLLSYTLENSMDLFKDGMKKPLNELAVGDFIRLEGPPGIRKSYPAQADATKVTLLDEVPADILIRGSVMDVLPPDGTDLVTFLIKGSVTGYGQDSEVFVRVPADAYLSTFAAPDGMDTLYPGDLVFVVMEGPLMESYPMQGTASSVNLLERNGE